MAALSETAAELKNGLKTVLRDHVMIRGIQDIVFNSLEIFWTVAVSFEQKDEKSIVRMRPVSIDSAFFKYNEPYKEEDKLNGQRTIDLKDFEFEVYVLQERGETNCLFVEAAEIDFKAKKISVHF